MEYISSLERRAARRGLEDGYRQDMQQGVREGPLAGIELGLELRFGNDGLRLMPEILEIEDVDVLRAVHKATSTQRRK